MSEDDGDLILESIIIVIFFVLKSPTVSQKDEAPPVGYYLHNLSPCEAFDDGNSTRKACS